MALIWADGFDHYGGATQLGQGGYQSVQGVTWANTAGNARTGTGYVQFNATATVLRRAITNPQRTLGQGVGFNMQTTPAPPGNSAHGIHFETTPGAANYANTIGVMPNPGLGFTIWCNGVAVGQTPNNLFALNSYYWIEAKATANSGVNTNDSSIEFRFQGGSGNGGTTLIVNGLNINGTFAYMTVGNVSNFANDTMRCDDWVLWDTTGARNNDFSGDRRCFTSFTTANGVNQDWTPTVAPAWQRINAVPPVDTGYIEATAVGNISEFTKGAITINTNDVAGVIGIARAFKSDAGVCTMQIGIHSGAVVNNGAAIGPGTSASYLSPVIWETDPNTGLQWQKADVDNATIRVTRAS